MSSDPKEAGKRKRRTDDDEEPDSVGQALTPGPAAPTGSPAAPTGAPAGSPAAPAAVSPAAASAPPTDIVVSQATNPKKRQTTNNLFIALGRLFLPSLFSDLPSAVQASRELHSSAQAADLLARSGGIETPLRVVPENRSSSAGAGGAVTSSPPPSLAYHGLIPRQINTDSSVVFDNKGFPNPPAFCADSSVNPLLPICIFRPSILFTWILRNLRAWHSIDSVLIHIHTENRLFKNLLEREVLSPIERQLREFVSREESRTLPFRTIDINYLEEGAELTAQEIRPGDVVCVMSGFEFPTTQTTSVEYKIDNFFIKLFDDPSNPQTPPTNPTENVSFIMHQLRTFRTPQREFLCEIHLVRVIGTRNPSSFGKNRAERRSRVLSLPLFVRKYTKRHPNVSSEIAVSKYFRAIKSLQAYS